MKISLNADGSAQISDADEGRVNANGTPAASSWSVNADQLGKHLRGIATAAHPWKNASPGDKSAAADAAASYAIAVAQAAANK